MENKFTVINGNTWDSPTLKIRFEHNPGQPSTITFNFGIPDLDTQGKIVDVINRLITVGEELPNKA